MQTDAKWSWVLPATGIVFVVLVVVGFIVAGEGPDATDDTAQQVVDFYKDNESSQTLASFLFGFASVAFLFFAGGWRRVLRDAEGPGGALSAVAFAGAIVFSTAAAIAASLGLALADLADDLDPSAVQAINGITWDYYIPFVVGMAPFLLASGIVSVRARVLPQWLGWIAVVLGIAALTPAGFFAFLAGLGWILVVSIVLLMRARGAPAAPAATPPAAA